MSWWPVMWYQNKLGIWSGKECSPLHAKVCSQRPTLIRTTKIQKGPTYTTPTGMPKMRINNTMVQGRNFTINTSRIETKTNPKFIEKIYLLWLVIQTNATSGTWIHRSREIKRNATNRGCSASIIELLCSQPKLKTALSQQWRDTENPQWCVILVKTKGPQKSSREHTIDRRSDTQSIKHNKSWYGIIQRSRSWRPLKKFQGRGTYPQHP